SSAIASLAPLPTIYSDLMFVLAITFVMFLKLFTLSGIPKYSFYADQNFYLADALKISSGQILYRDFFNFTFPGTATVYAWLIDLFGVSAWIPGATFVVLSAIFVILGLYVARTVLRRWTAYIPVLTFVAVPLRFSSDATHHWFSALCLLGAAAVVVPRTTVARVIAAASLCALATWFTQTRGLMGIAALATFALWEATVVEGRRRKSFKFLLVAAVAYCGALAALVAYPVCQAGFRRFWYDTVVFVLQFGPKLTPYNTFGNYMAWYEWATDGPLLSQVCNGVGKAFIYLLIPGIYLLVFVRVVLSRHREHDEGPKRAVVLICIFGAFAAFGVTPSADMLRLGADSMFAIILLAWYLSRLQAKPALALMAAASFGLCVYGMRSHGYQQLSLPAGKIAVRDSNTLETLRVLKERLHSADSIYEPIEANFYFVLNRQNPSPVLFLSNTPFTRPEDVSATVQALDSKQVRYVLWSSALDSSYEDLSADHLKPMRDYLHRNYRQVPGYPGEESLWERMNAPGGTSAEAHPGAPGR
ncbi:MAG TPA: hypothetical protein VFM10_07280, partial [Terriglobales bacterium]|nr:hypothetical protein [Terriglobales bacterium]